MTAGITRVGRGGYLGLGRKRTKRHSDLAHSNASAFDRSEADKARRATRDWLRDRDESNMPEFERAEGDELTGNGWE